MKRSRIKIAVLVGSAVLITMLIFLLIFNLIIRRNVRSESEEAIQTTMEGASGAISAVSTFLGRMVAAEDPLSIIESVIDMLPQEVQDTVSDLLSSEHSLYTADIMFVPLKDNSILKELEMVFSQEEKALSSWCKENDMTETGRLKLGDHIFYLQTAKEDQLSAKLVAYVDVTGEYEMIRQVNIILLCAAVVIGLIGCFAGYLLGRKMEQTQMVQKQFFENTSHELKTPLTAIRGYAEGIEKGVITDYPKTGRVIAAQVDHMSELVESILSMARIESGAQPLEKEMVDMPAFIQDCLLPMEGVVKNRGLQVDLQLEEGTALADPGQLEHAVTNLLMNSIKYAVSRISIFFRPGELVIWNDAAEVDEQELPHLFDRFYTGKNGNTGIGLALAKEIIELHGWRITVEKASDGIAFHIIIP